MNVSIYLGPLNGNFVDATHIEKGNPGIGGTQYCMLELAHYLNSVAGYSVCVLASRIYSLEVGIKFRQIEGDTDVCEAAKQEQTDILIMSQFKNVELESNIRQQTFKVVIWTHNYILYPFCKFITETPQICCNVFVGKQLYDRYIDDDVIKKSVYIHNMYTDQYPDVIRENDGKTVVYMGAIIPGKGFAELCSIWGRVLAKVSDAQLLVLGSGRLYGEAKLGRLGVASEEYERSFSKFITDSCGNIIPSVRFLGVVGEGKLDIFRRASVGVVNPSGRTETFGMGVLEMGEARLPVVTIGKNGYFDTVQNRKSGILSKSLQSMADDIVYLLKNADVNESYGEQSKINNKRFLPSVIGPKWDSLLSSIYSGNLKIDKLCASAPYSNNQKWLRMFLSFIRFELHMKFVPSLIQMESIVYNILYR